MVTDDRYYTTAEVARLLRVSNRSVMRWCKEGKIAAQRAGRQWRMKISAVEAFMTSPEGKEAIISEQAQTNG